MNDLQDLFTLMTEEEKFQYIINMTPEQITSYLAYYNQNPVRIDND